MTEKLRLPAIRSDLEFYSAPRKSNGEPVWMVRDPVQSDYKQVNWAQMQLIKRMHTPRHIDELHAELLRETPLEISREDIEKAIKDLIVNGLTTQSQIKNAKDLYLEVKAKKTSSWQWLIHHYLFFRIPLLRTDNFLNNTLKYAKILVSKPLLVIYTILILIGIYLVVQNFDKFLHTFPRFFTPTGILAYGGAIAFIKIIHEFSHAYTAKAFGNYVPTMGVTFIVLWPIPYCDVTDSWRMYKRSERLYISFAGIAAELLIAGLSLFGWAVLPEGFGRSICFVLSTVSIIGTVLVNLNPAMRFDGYYIFADLLGFDNLRPRAYSLTKWWYRSFFLGIHVAPPEEVTRKQLFILVAYSIYSWIYCFFLYLGIALFVYYTFTRSLGIALFSIEIFMFIINPVLKEVRFLYKMKNINRWNLRQITVLVIISLLLLWLIAPLPRRVSIPAITEATHEQTLYAPYSGILQDIQIKRDSTVTAGSILFSVYSAELESRMKIASEEVAEHRARLLLYSSRKEDKHFLSEEKESLRRTQAKWRSLNKQLQQNAVKAQFNGRILEWSDTANDGVAVYQQEKIGRIITEHSTKVIAYAPEKLISSITHGQKVLFIPEASPEHYTGKISKIDSSRVETLRHYGLSSLQQGAIAVISENGNLKLNDSYYIIEITLTSKESPKSSPLRLDQTGTVWLYTAERSYIKELLQHVYHVLMREFSF